MILSSLTSFIYLLFRYILLFLLFIVKMKTNLCIFFFEYQNFFLFQVVASSKQEYYIRRLYRIDIREERRLRLLCAQDPTTYYTVDMHSLNNYGNQVYSS
jgi:hypothetical protein